MGFPEGASTEAVTASGALLGVPVVLKGGGVGVMSNMTVSLGARAHSVFGMWRRKGGGATGRHALVSTQRYKEAI